MNLKKSQIATVATVSLSILYFSLWCLWRNGVQMSSSNWGIDPVKSKIIIRKIPSSAPLWALPLSFLPDDHPRYRCEFYRFSSPLLFSAQTYQGESFTARTARIDWNSTGVATVFLDNNPVLKCNPQGYWYNAN